MPFGDICQPAGLTQLLLCWRLERFNAENAIVTDGLFHLSHVIAPARASLGPTGLCATRYQAYPGIGLIVSKGRDLVLTVVHSHRLPSEMLHNPSIPTIRGIHNPSTRQSRKCLSPTASRVPYGVIAITVGPSLVVLPVLCRKVRKTHSQKWTT